MSQHHCRLCGGVYCDQCCNSKVRIPLYDRQQRACITCKQRVRDIVQEGQELIRKQPKQNLLVTPKNSSQPCYINILSIEILEHIISFIRDNDFFTILKICKVFNKVANSNEMWHRLYCQRWNVSTNFTEISKFKIVSKTSINLSTRIGFRMAQSL